MGKPQNLGHLAHIVAYDSANHITVPAGITMHTNQLVASQAWVTTALGSYALSTSLGSYVPTSRTITINGTTFDLSANRSWDITSMIYPAAGIALSTGTAWGTSITNNSANWNTAYGWGNHASAGYLTGITSLQVTTALGFTPSANTHTHAFADITAKPTTLAGYGITDAATSTHNHNGTYVPVGRTITINGTALDLSADRSWTVSGTDSTKMPLAGGVFTGLVTFAFSNTDAVQWPYIRFGPSATGWDEGIIKASSTEGVFGRYGMGIHFDSARAFGIYSSSWTKVMGFKSDAVTSYRALDVPTLAIGNSSSYLFSTNVWAGAFGHPGYQYTGGNARFGFSSTSGAVDVYTDGNFYCGIDYNGSNNLVLHVGNYSSYALPLNGNWGGSTGMNDRKLYLRTNGDDNHFLWNADDDWEELRYYTGTGFRVQSSNGTVPAYFNNAGVYASAYRGKDNVGGTGTASWHPDGMYSGGTEWLYGNMYRNGSATYHGWGNLHDVGTIYTNNWFRSYGDSGLYNQDYACHFRRNAQSSYGTWEIFGYNKNGYGGLNIYDPQGYSNNLMYENGNGGMYQENGGGWGWYYNRGSDCFAASSSTTNPSYRFIVDGTAQIQGDFNPAAYTGFGGNTEWGNGTTQYHGSNTAYNWRDWGGWGGYWWSRNGGDMIMNLYALYSVTGSISDIRYKKDVEALPYGLNEIMQLNPIKYHYNLPKESMLSNDPDYFLGFSAQEVQALIPEAVHEKVNEDVESLKGMLAITYDELIPVTVQAIKEQQVMIHNQNIRIQKLEALVTQLLNN